MGARRHHSSSQSNAPALIVLSPEIGRLRRNHDGPWPSRRCFARIRPKSDGHRRARDQGAAAERPQLRDARVPDARHTPDRRREPVGASTFNPRGASNFNALGHQANANAWLIDGIDNNEYSFNTVIIAPSVEQVREFKVLSACLSAEFGRGPGSCRWQPSQAPIRCTEPVFEYLRNDAFDARNFFVRKVPLASGGLQKDPKPPIDRHQFGGALGGALVIPGIYDGHSRTFFFADYAGLKEKRGQVFVNTVPTAQSRIGDFSDFRDTSGNLITIYDPLTTRLNPSFDSSRPVSATNPSVPARSVSQ
jgi:hypothetical protein